MPPKNHNQQLQPTIDLARRAFSAALKHSGDAAASAASAGTTTVSHHSAAFGASADIDFDSDHGHNARPRARPSAIGDNAGNAGNGDDSNNDDDTFTLRLALGPATPYTTSHTARSVAASRSRMLSAAGIDTDLHTAPSSPSSGHGAGGGKKRKRANPAGDADDEHWSEDDEHSDDTKRKTKRSRATATASASMPIKKAPGQDLGSDSDDNNRDNDEDENDHRDADSVALDRYFETASTSRKAGGGTSNATLAALPRLTHREYLEAVENMDSDEASPLAMQHAAARTALRDVCRGAYPQWLLELTQGFNLALIGYGSKRGLVTEFVDRYLADTHDVIEVDGYHPLASAKAVLSTLSEALRCPSSGQLVDHVAHVMAAISEQYGAPTAVSTLDNSAYVASKTTAARGRGRGRSRGRTANGALSSRSSTPSTAETAPPPKPAPLVLLMHGLDAPPFRSPAVVHALTQLASHPAVYLIATIDHVHASLLWDAAARARLRWITHHTPTFMPYSAETKWEAKLMVQQGATTPAAAATVLQSLPANSRACFKLLADQILELYRAASTDAGNNTRGPPPTMSIGMTYPAMYTRCREQFFVNEEASFRTILAEFRDHHIVVARRVDGMELLSIPLPLAGIEALLEKMQGM